MPPEADHDVGVVVVAASFFFFFFFFFLAAAARTAARAASPDCGGPGARRGGVGRSKSGEHVGRVGGVEGLERGEGATEPPPATEEGGG